MAKYKLQEMPDVHNTGKKRVYPKLVTNRQLGTKEFIERMRTYNHAYLGERGEGFNLPRNSWNAQNGLRYNGFPLKVL